GLAVLGRQGLLPGVEIVADLPGLGTAQMCVFGDEARQAALMEPLVRFLRDSLDASSPSGSITATGCI
ncbi:MAG: hypothetical protein H7345_01110, partial [Rubritepida sp.]|nr:hypothetical protein [Rubritepida sp.]